MSIEHAVRATKETGKGTVREHSSNWGWDSSQAFLRESHLN